MTHAADRSHSEISSLVMRSRWVSTTNADIKFLKKTPPPTRNFLEIVAHGGEILFVNVLTDGCIIGDILMKSYSQKHNNFVQ